MDEELKKIEEENKSVCCRTCRYVRFCEDNIQKCCKHAPTIYGFPIVKINDWCGEHKFVEGFDE